MALYAGDAEYIDSISAGRDKECLGYNTKQSDDETPIMLELWEKWSTPLLSSLQGLFWPRVLAPDRGWVK